MNIIIKLQGLPIEASSVDVRRYFLGLRIPDGGVHIVGGEDGVVFIEFSTDEDARQAMSKGDGTIKNSNIKLSLSSRTEMLSVVETARQKQLEYLQLQQQLAVQQQQPPQQLPQQPPQQPSAFIDPRMLSENYQVMLSATPMGTSGSTICQPQPSNLLPAHNSIFSQFDPATTIANSNANNLGLSLLGNINLMGGLNPSIVVGGSGVNEVVGNNMINNANNSNASANRNHSPDSRARMSGMRGGDDKLFANKRCVLAASNIPYRATSKDIMEFLSEFNINEDCIRRRYNQKGQPTADAKIAFPTPDAAIKALKMMNKKSLCGRPIFLKPV